MGYPKCLSTTLQKSIFTKHPEINYGGVVFGDTIHYKNESIELLFESILKYSNNHFYQSYLAEHKDILTKFIDNSDLPVVFSSEHMSMNFTLQGIDSLTKYQRIKEIFDELEFLRMKENFFKIFSDKKDELKNPTLKEDIQYDLFNSPGETNLNSSNKFIDLTKSKHLYQVIKTELGKQLLYEKLNNQTQISFKIIKYDIDNNFFGICLSWEAKKSYYLTIQKKDQNSLNQIKSIFQNNQIIKIGYDLKIEFQILNEFEIFVKGTCFDNKIAHYLINPDISHDLKLLCENYLNYKNIQRLLMFCQSQL